jgi:hypothetical protein
MTAISRRKILSYALLPGFRPRLKELFASGFQYIPYFIALVYQAVRLLPDNHPYLNPGNIGRYGVRHVIAEAANRLVISKKNIDQVVLFGAVLMGLGIVLLQIVILVLSLIAEPVMASMPTSFAGFFLTPEDTKAQDLALIMLDMTFGIPDLFGSCISTGVACQDMNGHDVLDYKDEWILNSLSFPFPVHMALHSMFQIYSIGLLVVAALITTYFIATILLETAQTGTAFGKRFNKVWAPLRIVMAFGLLIPLSTGLNSSQYIVLYAAKFGSGFATNGWNIFNSVLGEESFTSGSEKLISQPNAPEVGGLLQFLYVASVCAELEWQRNYDFNLSVAENEAAFGIYPYLVRDPLKSPSFLPLPVSYEELIDFAGGGSKAIIRFGKQDAETYADELGTVAPVCGEIILPLTDPRNPGDADNPPERGPEIMQRYYLFVIWELWSEVFFGDASHQAWGDCGSGENYVLSTVKRFTKWNHDPNAPLPIPKCRATLQDFYSTDLVAAMNNPPSQGLEDVTTSDIGAINEQLEDGNWQFGVLRQKGWGGAGIWYNKIAQLNGSTTASVLSVPLPSRYPRVMGDVLRKKQQQDQMIAIDKRFEPKLANGDNINFADTNDSEFAGAMWEAFKYWQADGHSSTSRSDITDNAFNDAIMALLGTDGLYSMRNNPDVHPLAQLVGVGRSLVESAIRNFGISTGASVGGALASLLDKVFGDAAKISIGMFMTVAMISLTAGFTLFYIVPFLPFIYFFFAMGGWIKGIFEAMIGAPLWALAHIRIDGEGLPGQAAISGYFLIFEIFLRPILIVFGLLASISIFGAIVSVMNVTWELVLANLTGFDVKAEITGETASGEPAESLTEFLRNPIDTFFFTVLYAIVAYMMAMSSFKLIDLIPNNILRWMGQSVSSFNDQQQDPAAALSGKATVGAQQALSTIGGSAEQLQKGVVDAAQASTR